MQADEQHNKIEVRVHGLQRSGNHGIINWIAMQSRIDVLVLNDAKPFTNPFHTMQECIEYRKGDLFSAINAWDDESRVKAAARAPAKRDVLMYSYEDRELMERDSRLSQDWLGVSEIFVDVIVVRDPLNFFASRLQMWNTLTGLKDKHKLVELWKSYAREALGYTTLLGSGAKIVANFTNWAQDPGYRERLAGELHLDFSDRGFDQMVRVGPGSSFDGFSFENNASKMPVNDRWKLLISNQEYRSILDDGETKELSDELFGPLEGWQQVLS